ncbi:MAG: pilus assembly PilX N-terminal domain-containing protein [Bacillota bacterium]|nr:pilus assembly PilX N-terminal domain-containing protein [Bacillota bacterium]
MKEQKSEAWGRFECPRSAAEGRREDDGTVPKLRGGSIKKHKLKTTLLLEEKGTILFLVLFITSVLMILGTAFLKNSLSERAIARNYEYKIRAHYIAEAGVDAALGLISEQPAFFLENAVSTPVYLSSGDEEEYFILEWLQPGSPGGNAVYYTLQSRGYYRNTGNNAGGQAVVNVFLDISFLEEDEEFEEEEHGNEEHEDDESRESNGENIKIKFIRWSGR